MTFGEDAGVDVTDDGPVVLPKLETNYWLVSYSTLIKMQ